MTDSSRVALWIVLGGVALLFLPRVLDAARRAFRIHNAVARDRHRVDLDRDLVAAYDRLAPDDRPALDERTWADLDLDAVFGAIDRTQSVPGRQYLYHLLRRPQADRGALDHFERLVQEFSADASLARHAREALGGLAERRAAYLAHLLYGDVPARPWFWPLFPVLSVSAMVCALLIAAWPVAALAWLATCAANVVVQVVYRPRVEVFVPALRVLRDFLGVARELSAMPVSGSAAGEVIRALERGAAETRSLRRATSWLAFEPGESAEVTATLYGYANLLFLLDVNALAFATNDIRRHAGELRAMFEALGTVDAALSVAEWRRSLGAWTTPDFTAAPRTLSADAVVHPLLNEPVANDVGIQATSVLVTGSNMSGKTTFLRTLGVNAVLATTVHTVCASRWHAPLLRVRTAIGRSDSVISGQSYYHAEVLSVRDLVEARGRTPPHLFLLDEVFRGTNTVERVAAAYAVLHHLTGVADIVVAATHDVELVALLAGEYALFHFREDVADDGLTFDYRLRPGPSTTRNAIALLRAMRYPDSLVDDALRIVERSR